MDWRPDEIRWRVQPHEVDSLASPEISDRPCIHSGHYRGRGQTSINPLAQNHLDFVNIAYVTGKLPPIIGKVQTGEQYS